MQLRTLLVMSLLTGCGLSPMNSVSDTGGLSAQNILMIGDVQVSPATIDFGAVKPGDDAALEVVLTNLGDDVVNLSSAYLEGDPAFTMAATVAPADIAAGTEVVLSVAFSPDEELAYTGGLNLLIGGEADFTVLPIDGLGSESAGGDGGGDPVGPQLSISDTTINFGEVKVSDAASQLVTMSNTGDEALSIESVTSSSSWFEVEPGPLPLELGPGDESDLQIRFVPQEVNTASAQITVVNDSGNNPTITAIGEGGDDCTFCNPVIEVSTIDGDPYKLSVSAQFLLNNPATETISVRNSGDRDLVISEQRLLNNTYESFVEPDLGLGICGNKGMFSITSTTGTLTIPPNESRSITVQYYFNGSFDFNNFTTFCWDSVPGFEDSSLTLISNDPGGEYVIKLAGRYGIL